MDLHQWPKHFDSKSINIHVIQYTNFKGYNNIYCLLLVALFLVARGFLHVSCCLLLYSYKLLLFSCKLMAASSGF